MEVDEQQRIGGSPFVIGETPGGFGAKFYAHDEGGVIGKVIIDATKQGPPGHAHGGALATLVDEAMGASAWHAGHRVLAVNLNFNLRHAVPLDQEVTLRGRVDRQDGRKVFASAELLLSDGRVAVEGTGIFVEAPELAGRDGDNNPFQFLSPE